MKWMTGERTKNLTWLRRTGAVVVALIACSLFAQTAIAQDGDDRDDPPDRVARIGYLQGSVSFQPAGESDWVEAVPNRPMTTGDQLWSDHDSRAELSLGAAAIRLNSNTGISILNLDDRTAQIQLSSGSINLRVRHMGDGEVFEIDTPNQAFSIFEPGRYRVEASDDGTYSVVSIREGGGESTGNGQTYELHAGQRATFQGTDRLSAQIENIWDADDFDNWSYGRDRRYENSPSARYLSPDVVGYEDLDDSGEWRPDPNYGSIWFPRVAVGWAPYHQGHWAWIDPWGWTWVEDEPWGYAPFHYGRWVSADGRWGWVPGPREVRPVYAPALVVFVGGAGGFGGNMAWFALGPREVYVPSYTVSRAYVNRVNVSNTTVNVTQVTNVYNTTIINKTTVINNVTYVNRNVTGAVTAVPQQAFSSGQPVARVAVVVNARDIASAPVNARAVVAPTRESVLGLHAATANHVAAPPAAIASRAVVAKAHAPPPPVPFAARQQALAAHPGQPIAHQQMQQIQQSMPHSAAVAARPAVRQAPPGKPATPTAAPPSAGRPGSQPANMNANRPVNQPAPGAQPANRPNQPANEPANRPGTPPAANERPGMNQEMNRPVPNNQQQNNQPTQNNRPAEPPARNDRPNPDRPNADRPNADRPDGQPNNRPQPNQPQPNHPETNQPQQRPNQPPTNRPQPNQAEPNNRSAEPPQRTPPPQTRPTQPAQQRPLTPEEKKKQQEEQKKRDEKPN